MAEPATATGIERIEAAFAAARSQGRAALMPYMMGGFPDQATALAVAEAYADGGADLVELGAPYSDPLADGPVIHHAATRALAAGTRLDDVLAICSSIADRVPVLPMVYANMALSRGAEQFAAALSEAGAAGAIIPDLPPGEDAELPAALEARGLAMVPFVSPTSSAARRKALVSAAHGFVYVVSLTGVTGERAALPGDLAALVDAVREESAAPVAVGFGISTPERAAEVGAMADGVIIGSRLVREVEEAGDAADAARRVTDFLRSTLAALSGS